MHSRYVSITQYKSYNYSTFCQNSSQHNIILVFGVADSCLPTRFHLKISKIVSYWCLGRDSNSQGHYNHEFLRLARIPFRHPGIMRIITRVYHSAHLDSNKMSSRGWPPRHLFLKNIIPHPLATRRTFEIFFSNSCLNSTINNFTMYYLPR